MAAAVKRGMKKSYLPKKTIKRQRWTKKNVSKPRKLPSRQKKKAGAIKIRKRNSLRMCPLVSLILKSGICNKVLPSQKHKAPFRVGKQKKTPRMGCGCSTYLLSLLKEASGKKRAKSVVAAPKKKKLAAAAPKRKKVAVAAPKRRTRNPDDEILYRLADVLEEDLGEGGSGADAQTNPSSVPGPENLAQAAVNEPQPVATN